MAAPRQLKDVIKNKVADAVRRHINVDAIAADIASAVADEIEATARDRARKTSTTAMRRHFETSIKKGRGRAQKSHDLIEAMRAIAEAAQPITGNDHA